MTLWLTVSHRGQLKGRPCVHALIVGVSEYGPHLPPENGPEPPKGPPAYGMRSLTTPAASAAAVFKWLVAADAQDLLPGERKLATCRLLLAPSISEVGGLGLNPLHVWQPATQPSFEKAAVDWRNDAADHADHMTLFYFAGHGLQLSPSEQVLLFPGFGDPDRPVLATGVSLEEILVGMGPSDRYPQIGRKAALPGRFV